MKRLLLALLVAPALVATLPAQNTAPTALDKAFTAYWAAKDVGEAEAAAKAIVASGGDFDVVVKRLKAGRTYAKQSAGPQAMVTEVRGARVENLLEVPAEYDPAKQWQMRVQLHGGVGRPAPRPGEAAGGGRGFGSGRVAGEPQLYLNPRAWEGIEWWKASQVDNIVNLVDAVKRKYNVDESRVYVTGISDGGTGVYFMGMREATLFSACLSLNGHPAVLANPDVGAEQQLYLNNLVNCPFYAVNGGQDQLYPAVSVRPYVDAMKRGGIPVNFTIYPDAGHNTAWWPEERQFYETFLGEHPRLEHPSKVTWSTDRVDRYNRFRWLVITALATRPSDTLLDEVNKIDVRGGERPVFSRNRPTGRVDIERKGNVFDAKTRGVQTFTLLLSPDVVDFTKPVRVVVNGKDAFSGAVKKDVATLMKWAARDNDRTMLYGAELAITVP